MERMDRSDESGSEDGLDASEDDDDQDSEDDEETSEQKAKIKQYTAEIKQLETLIEKKRAGFTGGNPIITKRFEETIKGLQDDVNTKVAVRQALLDEIEAKTADAGAAAATDDAAKAAATPAAGDEERDDSAGLFDDDADGEGEFEGQTPAATPGMAMATPMPEGESPAAESDEDLFGDDDDDDGDGESVGATPAATPGLPTPAVPEGDAEGEGEEEDGDDAEGDFEMGGDEDAEVMDEMALLLQAELGGQPDPGDIAAAAVSATEAGADAAALALDDLAAAGALEAPSSYGFSGVEGGVGMRRLASGVIAADDSSDDDDSDDD